MDLNKLVTCESTAIFITGGLISPNSPTHAPWSRLWLFIVRDSDRGADKDGCNELLELAQAKYRRSIIYAVTDPRPMSWNNDLHFQTTTSIAGRYVDREKFEKNDFSVLDVNTFADKALVCGFSTVRSSIASFITLSAPSQTSHIVRMTKKIKLTQECSSIAKIFRATHPTDNLLTDIFKGPKLFPPKYKSICTLPLFVSPVKYACELTNTARTSMSYS